MGMTWGLGHTTTLLIVGGTALLLNVTIPDNLAGFMELLVGFLLIGLGVRVFYKLSQGKLHTHSHDDGETHEHMHPHGETTAHEHTHQPRSLRQTFLIGLLHGSAGSSAAVVLVVTMIDAAWQGLMLILLFGLGSVVGMMLVGLLLGVAGQFMDRVAGWQRLLNVAAGALSIVLGLLISVEFFAGL